TTAPQKKLFYNLRRLKAELGEIGEGDLPEAAVTEIARRLEVPEADVVSMNRRMQAADSSLNTVIGVDGEMEWLDRLEDDGQTPEAIVIERDELDKRRAMLADGLQALNE